MKTLAVEAVHGLGPQATRPPPRLVRLSAEGNICLASAGTLVAAHQGTLGPFDTEQHRLVVGISHHIVGAELPVLLKRINSAEPRLMMEMRIAASRDVLADFDRGAMDASSSYSTIMPAEKARPSSRRHSAR